MEFPDTNALRASADQRIRDKIRDATNKRTIAKQKRSRLAKARAHGLEARHAAKLARAQQSTVDLEGGQE